MTIILIGLAIYAIYKVHQRYEYEGLGRAIGSIFLIILGIVLLVFLPPIGVFTGPPIGYTVYRLWRNL